MDLEEVIKDIEENALFTRGVTSKIFKSMLNQPSLVSVNSANAVKIESENGYYTFKIDFPRPILDVDTIQLLTTSIPQANASIPNTAITFWYYRLSSYTGTTPSLNNLYCVRLLPSYYKPEFIYNPTTYGLNKTFPSYSSLATELAKSCVTDLGYYNLQNYLIPTQPNDAYLKFPFLPGDISITYNASYNKFQMTGNTTSLAYQQYDAGVTYIIGSVVFYTDTFYEQPRTRAYTSLQNANLNHTPSSSPTWWQPTSNEIVAEWKLLTTYLPGNFVRYFGLLYRAKLRNTDITPDNDFYWTQVLSGAGAYNYLITGYEDPNVAIKQGVLFDLPFERTHYYQTGERVRFKDRVFQAITEGGAYTPGNINIFFIANTRVLYNDGNFVREVPNEPIQNWTILTPNPTNQNIWSQYETYEEGDLVYYGGNLYRCKVANTDVIPFVFTRWEIQAEYPLDALPWSSFITYPANSIVIYGNFTYLTIIQSAGNVPGMFGGWVIIGRNRWTSFNFAGSDTETAYFNGQYFDRNTTAFNGLQPVLAWNINTSYPANAFVSKDERVYRSIVSNQASPPTEQIATWSSTQEYTVNETVVFNNTQYRSRTDNFNAPPSGLIEWTAGQNWIVPNIVKVTGAGTYRCYNPINGGNAPNSEPAYWELLSEDTDAGVIWEPFGTWEDVGASNWDVLQMQTEKSGLNGLSELCDFIDNTGGANVKADFPAGIPGQPFNISPERLLNSILGFTWNGVFVPSALTNLYTDVIDGKFVSLYNRLRPVPNYDVLRDPALLGFPPDPPPTAIVTRTYTAEGYANLVYSSIVNIYTNIVGGSTLDTVRNTNLVATTSMNCGNLGIAFHGNYIETPLQRVAGDINELTIELRDEVGEPFYLTNNAIMTATFKITYKDGGVRIEEPE